MTNRSDEIKQANRKALPKFILIVVLACLVGGVLGFSVVFFGLDGMSEGLRAAGTAFSRRVAPWLLALCAVLDPLICLPMYFTSKREVAAWDGEDEEISDRVDRRLSIVMWINSMVLICAFFLVSAAYSGGLKTSFPMFILGIGGFLLVMVEAIVIQQKLVDLSKRLNPEKQGSVYDVKFQKKWLNSCDEAEKLIIGQCAYKAYSAGSNTCMVLWCVFALSALFLDTGFLPVLAVCVVWGVLQSVYCYWAIKLSSPSSAPL